MQITVYSTSGCSKCEELKQYLRRIGESYNEVSLEDTGVQAKFVMMNLPSLSSPVLQINDQYYFENSLFVDSCERPGSCESILLEPYVSYLIRQNK